MMNLTFKRNRILQAGVLLVLLASLFLTSGCTASTTEMQTVDGVKMAPMKDMPAEIQDAAQSVSEAYRFAVANPDVLKEIPCYCGCGAAGHTSNYSCYVKEVKDDGSIVFDSHGLGCSICVDIALDTMRLLKQGQSTDQIRAFIDQNYGSFGPSNIP